jgi:RNA ligase
MKFERPTKYIDEKLVTEREHDTEPYVIYNYTPKCQFSKSWDDVTMMCRGLIVHKYTREIIARPFTKFFNYEEHLESETLPQIPSILSSVPNVQEKYDGSLGILYFGEDEETPYIATRGSFNSDQAKWATDFYRKSGLSYPNDGNTYLFEIIYPENRIVVDYKDFKGLVELAVLNTETGKTFKNSLPCHCFTSFKALKEENKKNKEGYILFYPEIDLRIKVKFEDYKKLHKVMTGLSEKSIWEMSKDKKTEEIMSLPDEMHNWVKDIIVKLLREHDYIENRCMSLVSMAKNHSNNRKEQAEFILNEDKEYSSICFSMLDNKDYRQQIYKIIKPKGQSTFRVDIDA